MYIVLSIKRVVLKKKSIFLKMLKMKTNSNNNHTKLKNYYRY